MRGSLEPASLENIEQGLVGIAVQKRWECSEFTLGSKIQANVPAMVAGTSHSWCPSGDSQQNLALEGAQTEHWLVMTVQQAQKVT